MKIGKKLAAVAMGVSAVTFGLSGIGGVVLALAAIFLATRQKT